MAISLLGSIGEFTDTATPIGTSQSHTVTSGTTILIACFGSEGDLTISSVNWNTSEAMTLIGSVTTSSSGGDVRVWVYGLVNPTATTANVSWSVAGAGDNAWGKFLNFDGTITSSVAAATNLIDSQDNANAAATTVALSGATTSASCLLVAGTFRGGDGDPATVTGAGTFTVDSNATGTSTTTDTSWCVGYDVDGGTGSTVSPTIDWVGGASDECVGVFIEILEATADTNIDAGTDSLTLTTYAALAQVAPRVWLNTSQTKTGATEMTVTAWNTAGTSITFTDDTGGPTGSLYLGVEDPRNGYLGWIAVTVTASGTNVSATVDALTLTEQNATITVDRGVSAGLDALTLTAYNPTVGVEYGVSAGVSALTLTEYQATLTYDVGVSASVDALTLTEYAATLTYDVGVNAGVDPLSLTAYPASVTVGVNVDATVDALSLTAYPATIVYDVGVSASAASLSITTYAATVSTGVTVSASAASLSLTEHPVSLAVDVGVTAGVDALSLTAYPASISVGVNVSAGVDALTLTAYQPSITYDVDVQASADSLTITAYSAVVSLAAAEAESAPTGGISRKKRKQNRANLYVVEVDGQDFIVSSQEEAAQLLERARELAERKVSRDVAQIVERSKSPTRAIQRLRKLDKPVIKSDSSVIEPIIQKYRKQIEDIYKEAVYQAEQLERMRLAEEEDEDDAITLLLLH